MTAGLLAGQAAVVTGAGRGIGRAIARRLAAEGAVVALAARTGAQVEATARSIEAAGGRAVALTADVSREEDCERLIAAAVGALGRLDVLVNNAGTARFRPFWELTLDDYEAILGANLRGVFLCSRAAVRAMIPARRGTIVNIASTSGKKPYPRQSLYCASKAAVIAFSRCMALDAREHGIRVHAVCPGAVDTPLANEIHPERDRDGWLRPEDVAEAVVYLLRTPPNVVTDELVLRRFHADPI